MTTSTVEQRIVRRADSPADIRLPCPALAVHASQIPSRHNKIKRFQDPSPSAGAATCDTPAARITADNLRRPSGMEVSKFMEWYS